MLAEYVGKELRGCSWVGIPFAGGMSELPHIKASSIVVSDLHRHVINLARVIQNHRDVLAEQLALEPFHPDTLAHAQEICRNRLHDQNAPPDIVAARAYFICCWMGRSAKAGTDDEFSGKLPVRWSASGGDSNTRFRSAVASLHGWGEIMQRCNFVVQDAFDFLANVKDIAGNGLYCDPPFPGPGDAYSYRLDNAGQRKLASKLAEFKQCRIVCRFYDHPLVRELYPGPHWTWNRLTGRKQSNDAAPEVLILNGPSRA